jgi:hypothetical protein
MGLTADYADNTEFGLGSTLASAVCFGALAETCFSSRNHELTPINTNFVGRLCQTPNQLVSVSLKRSTISFVNLTADYADAPGIKIFQVDGAVI